MANSGNNKFVSVNLNKSYGQQGHGGGNRPKSGGGMVVLSKQRSQIGGTKVAKLAVPPPLNLPSLRREHGGGDHSVGQSVAGPVAGSGFGIFGWNKVNSENPVAIQDGSGSRSNSAVVGDAPWSGHNHGENAKDSPSTRQNLIRNGIYAPPAARPLTPKNASVPASSSSVVRAVLLKGEDFPSLQAAVSHPPINPQKPKDSQQKIKHLSDNNQNNATEKLEVPSNEQISSDDQMRPPPLRPRQATDLSSNAEVGNGSAYQKKTESVVPPALVRMNHTSNWADDERDTGRNLPSHDFDRLYESQYKDNKGYRSNGVGYDSVSFVQREFSSSRDFFKGREEVGGKDLSYSRDGSRDFSYSRDGRREREGNFGFDRDRGFSGRESMSRDYDGGSRYNGGFNSRNGVDDNRENVMRRDVFGKDVGRDSFSKFGRGGQEGHFGGSGRDGPIRRVGEQNSVGETHGTMFNRNRNSKSDASQYNPWNKNSFSMNKRTMNLDDPILDFGREKRSSFNNDSFMKDFGNLLGFDFKDPLQGVLGNEIKIPRRKKSDFQQTNFYDPARESFEAELERVQQMQEMEKQRVIEEQEKAQELARKEEEERERLAREEEEQRRRIEEEQKEAAWREQQEQLEASRRVEEEKKAREEERRRVLMEEERRKEAARRKLLELEERMAKRKSEKEEAKVDNDGSSLAKFSNDRDLMRRPDRGDWEEEERIMERITSSASSESSNPSRSFEARVCPPVSAEAYVSDRNRPANVWRREHENEGGLSHALHMPLSEQSNNHYSANRESLPGGRGFRRDSFDGARSVSNRYLSKPSRSELLHGDECVPSKNVQRWSPDDERAQHSFSLEVNDGLPDNKAIGYIDMRWGQERYDSWQSRDRHAGPSTASYSHVSEVDDFNFGRSRHSIRQPKVLPPPSVSVMPKDLSRKVKPISSLIEEPKGKDLDSETRRLFSRTEEKSSDKVELLDFKPITDSHVSEEDEENNDMLPPSSPPLFDSQEDSQEEEASHFQHSDVLTVSMPANDANSDDASKGEYVEKSQDEFSNLKSLNHEKHEEWVIDDEDDYGDEDEEDEDNLYEEGVYEQKSTIEEGQNHAEFHIEEKMENEQENGFANEGVEVEKHMIDNADTVVSEEGSILTSNDVECLSQDKLTVSQEVPVSDTVESVDHEIQPSRTEREGCEDREDAQNASEVSSQALEISQVPNNGMSSLPSAEHLQGDQLDLQDSLQSSVESLQETDTTEAVISAQQSTSLATSVIQTTTVSHAPSHPNQSEFPIKLQFGLFPGHSILPATVPAIQIGSIQMPLHLHPQVTPSLSQLPSAQPPLFSLAQVRFPASMSQGLLPFTQPPMPFMHPNVSPHFSIGQTRAQHPLQSQQFVDPSSQNSTLADSHQLSEVANSEGLTNRSVESRTGIISSKEPKDVTGNAHSVGKTEQNHNDASLFVGRNNLWQPGHKVHESPPGNANMPTSQNPHSINQSETTSNSIPNNTGSTQQSGIGQDKSSQNVSEQYENGMESTWPSLPHNNKFRRQGRRGTRRNDFRPTADRLHYEEITSSNNHTHKREGRSYDHQYMDTPSSSRGRAKKVYGATVETKTDKFLQSKPHVKNELETFPGNSSHISEETDKMQEMAEAMDEAPLQSGVVRIYKQSGIEIPSDVDDFIEVRSKRQMLNDRREQREKEIKAKSKELKARDHAVRKQRNSGKVFVHGDSNTTMQHRAITSPANGRQIPAVPSRVKSENSTVNGKISSPSVGFPPVSQQPLAPIGTPSQMDISKEERAPSSRSIQSVSAPGISHGEIIEGRSSGYDNQSLEQETANNVGAWGSKRASQKAVSRTQIHLQEVMKLPSIDTKPKSLPSLSKGSSIALESRLSTSSILTQNNLHSGPLSLNSILGGERIQFGAITPPSLLSPVSSCPSMSAVSSGLSASINCGLSKSLESRLSAADDDSSNFFNKTDDADAEAEAAASAVAVAAISSDEHVSSSGLGSIVISTAESKGFETLNVCASSTGVSSATRSLQAHTRSEDSMAVALPADLSVENPALSIWSAMPSRPNSSGHMHPHFPATHSHFPCFEMGPMLGSPIFAFGQHDEAASLSQGQKSSNTADQGLGMSAGPVGGWQQCHTGVDSYYGAPGGFTGPFISPPAGIPGIQGPPHMFVYTNPFTPVGQFGQLGLSFMGTTYIPSGKQPDWKHTPISSSGAISDVDIGMMSAQRNPGISNAIPHVPSGSSVMPVMSHQGLFEMNSSSPFQSSIDPPMQTQWSHIVSPQLHPMLVSSAKAGLSMQPHQTDNLSTQAKHDSGGNRFHQIHGSKSGSSGPFSSIDAAAHFPDELGLGDSVSKSNNPLLSSHMHSNRSNNYNSLASTNLKAPKSKSLSRNVRPGGIVSNNDNTGLAQVAIPVVASGSQPLRGSRTVGSQLHSQSNVQQAGSNQYPPHPIGYTEQRASSHQPTGQKSGGSHDWSGHQHRKGSQGRTQIPGEKNFPAKVKQIYVAKPSSSSSSSTSTNVGRPVELLQVQL